jgi:hypothetical protein
VDNALFLSWKEDKATLEEWTERFGIASSVKEVLTGEGLKASTELNEKARNLKTPMKSPHHTNEADIKEMLSLVLMEDLYKRMLNNPEDLEKLRDTSSDVFSGVIQGIEEKLKDAATEQVNKKIKLELPILFSKKTSIDSIIGKQVKNESAEFSDPTLWSSIAMLTTMIHNTQAQLYSNPQLANAIKEEVSKEGFENINQAVLRPVINTSNGLQELKAVVVVMTSLQQIGNWFQHESARADALQFKVTNMDSGSYWTASDSRH